jgi:hypothetical protein
VDRPDIRVPKLVCPSWYSEGYNTTFLDYGPVRAGISCKPNPGCAFVTSNLISPSHGQWLLCLTTTLSFSTLIVVVTEMNKWTAISVMPWFSKVLVAQPAKDPKSRNTLGGQQAQVNHFSRFDNPTSLEASWLTYVRLESYTY